MQRGRRSAERRAQEIVHDRLPQSAVARCVGA
jgi:hypothetical protein